MEKALLAAISTLFSTLLGAWALYRKLGASKDREIRRLNDLLVASADAHRETLERKEKEKDAVEGELRGLYERMLDAAHAAKRGTPEARPHRGAQEPIAKRRERLKTVTVELTPDEREKFAALLAQGIVPRDEEPQDVTL